MSPALAGGFLATGQLGKSRFFFKVILPVIRKSHLCRQEEAE